MTEIFNITQSVEPVAFHDTNVCQQKARMMHSVRGRLSVYADGFDRLKADHG